MKRAALLLSLALPLSLATGCASPMRVGLRAWESGNGPRAVESWAPLAEAGDPEAQFLLGLAHEEGRGTAPDLTEAARWYGLAAEQGHPGAQTNLGLLHFRGAGVERSVEKAARWYRAAADQGYAPAQNNLAVLELLGHGVGRDVEHARALLTDARAGGDANAARIEDLLDSGTSLHEHVALRDLELRAEAGEPEAQYELALTHYHGETPDAERAAHWFARAADGGHAKACTCYARMLLEGLVVESDDQRAAAYLQVAADQGFAQAQYDLGLLHLRGRGVPQDDQLACDLLGRAARQDHRPAIAKLGVLEHAVWQDRLVEIRSGQGIAIPRDPAPDEVAADPSEGSDREERVARADERP